MKKITFFLSMVLLALTMSLTSCVNDWGVIDNPNDSGNTPEKNPNFKSIIVMSDIHVMAPQLLVNRGTAYENYLNQDPKLLEYSGEVLEYLVGKTLQRNPDLVIIPGDLTKDGELLSHQLVVNILGKLRKTTHAPQRAHRPNSLLLSMRTSATTRHTQKTLPHCRSSVNR